MRYEMEIIRTYEADGELWGETPGGERVQWDRGASRWRRATPVDHFSDEKSHNPAVTGVRVPQVATNPHAAMVGTTSAHHLENGTFAGVQVIDKEIEPQDPFGKGPMVLNPLDELWNKKFPPFSRRRLLFGIVMLPIIGLANAAWRSFRYGEDFSWPVYLFAVIAGSIILAAVFAVHWARQGTTGETGNGNRDVLGWPNPLAVAASKADPTKEILLATLLFFIGMIGSMAMVSASTVSALSVFVVLMLAGVISTLLHYRAWILLAALFSAAVGFIPALFLTMFNAFMSGSQNLLFNWLVASFVVFTFVAPTAWHLKRKAKELDRGTRFPTWVIAALSCVLMLLSTGFFAAFENTGTPTEAETAAQGPPHLRSTLMSPRIASQQLYLAWQGNSMTDAEKVASPEVVRRLFSTPYINQVYRGCGYMKGDASDYWCVIHTDNDLLLLKGVHTEGGFYIGDVRNSPLTTPIVGVTVAD